MSAEPKTSSPKPEPWTTSRIMKLVPQNWHDVEICIGDSWDRPEPIKRLSLHTNRNGRRVILLHKSPIKSPEEPA